MFNFKFAKLNPGVTFQGLDLITKLLTKPNKVKRPLIEEINNGILDKSPQFDF